MVWIAVRIAALTVLMAGSGCAVGTTGSTGARSPGPVASPPASVSASASAATAPEPTGCPGRGRLIPAVEIPAVHAAPVEIPEQQVGGQTIPAVTIPGVDIPAARVPAQCAEVADAPGGCLGAVSIPPVIVPAVQIPAVEIPAIRAAGIDLPAKRAEAARAGPETAPGASAPEECQVVPREGLARAVVRPPVFRRAVIRPTVIRPRVFRPRACNAERECVRAVSVPPVLVPPVYVPAVTVPGAMIESRIVGRSEVLKGDDSIAYSINADVLFDFDRAEIKPAAAAELDRVAKAIRTEVPATAAIRIDGHTDAVGDDTYNQRLSERRAAAVADWLATNARIDRGRLRPAGYGERKPVAPNTNADGSDNPAGRTKNRRVVLSAER